MTPEQVDAWFIAEVLPLESTLERYLRRNWRDADEIADLRQDVYTRVYVACTVQVPDSARAFVLSTARNLLVDRARRSRIVSIETFADVDALMIASEFSTERHVSARSELRFLQTALDALPPRCREVVELRKIEGLSQKEVAAQMGITEDTVERQMANGIRALAAAFLRPAAVVQDRSGEAKVKNRSS